MTAEDRPLLRARQQIAHLKQKGVTFEIFTDSEALEYLKQNSNYFKLRAFRKGFYKHSGGLNAGKYSHLDFAYLRDLSIVDMRLRYCMLPITLDIEHCAKVKLLDKLDQSGDNGYYLLKKMLETNTSLSDRIGKELSQKEQSPYCQELIQKYRNDMPAWVYVEVVSFGSFMTFCKFVAQEIDDKDLLDDFFLLHSVKRLRNACAHSNCILNDLSVHNQYLGRKGNINYVLRRDLLNAGVSKETRDKKMSNPRIYDLITTMYTHQKIVVSEGLNKRATEDLVKLKQRLFHHIDYYQTNQTISSSFNFMKKMIDYWFPVI